MEVEACSPEVRNLILSNAKQFGLDPILIACVILKESGGDLDAIRFEEKWHAARLLLKPRSQLAGYVPEGGTPSLYDEKIWRGHSFGPMQILGETARVLGFRGKYLPQLQRRLDLSIKYGCMWLSRCMVRARNGETFGGKPSLPVEERGLLGYNGGGDPNYPGDVLEFRRNGQAMIYLGGTDGGAG